MIETASETFSTYCQYFAVWGLLSTPFVVASKPLLDVSRRGRKWVKKVGVPALIVPGLCLFGTMKEANPTLEEKDLLRGLQAEEAEERRICGEILVGGGSVHAAAVGGVAEAGLRSGEMTDPA